MYGMMWWLLPLLIILVMRGRSRRHWRWQHRYGPPVVEDQSGYVAELQQTVEEQRVRIEELEGRLARVEDGLEFAERLLTERPIPIHPEAR
jgi:hypothetical protein